MQQAVEGVKGWLQPNLWNDFFSPMSPDVDDGTLYYNQQGEFEAQLAIGSKLFPEYPLRGHREAYYQLQKTLGMRANAMHSFDISGPNFHETQMVIGIDCKKKLKRVSRVLILEALAI